LCKFHCIHHFNSTFYRYSLDTGKGVEIDILLDNGSTLFPIQIKASQTFQESHLKPMQQWNNFSGNVGGLLLYDGEQEFTRKDKIRMQNWKTISKLKI